MFQKRIICLLGSLLIASITACGGGSGGNSDTNQQNQTTTRPEVEVIGAVQKGPFVIGSTVTVNLLSPDAVNTDSTVVTNTIDDLGNFTFFLDESSDLLELSATGYYRNEITGELSQGTMTLRSIISLSDQEEQTAYINLLTHLTSQRIKNLISNDNLQFESAQNQAEREFLIAFSEVVPNSAENDFTSLSIYNDELTSGSSYLLSASSILYKYALNQSNTNSTNPDAELTLLLNELEADFGADGTFGDNPILESLRRVIPEIDPSIVSSNIDDWINGVDGFERVDINEYLDTDLDGIFNAIDMDDDNDGVEDEFDTSPYQQSFIVADQAVEVNEDQSTEVDIETNNPLGIEVRVDIISSASNGVVSGSYPNLTYSPNANFEGSDSFSYQLTQGEISSEVVTVSLSVIGQNDAPSITGNPITEFMAHNAYSFAPTISDIENDSLELSIENLPGWASFNDQTGEITGSPTNDDVGLYENILLSANDGNLMTEYPSFDIEVQVNPYELGFLVENQELETNEDNSINIDTSSNNPLGIDIDLTISQSPNFGSVQGDYPELIYTPNENYNGADTFKYRLSQDIIESGEVTITINILPVNDTPTVSGTPDNSVTAFEAFSFVPTSFDIDEDDLEYSVQNLPSWASFDDMTGEISGSPDNKDIGVYQEILISVSDGNLSADLGPFQVEVIGNPWETLPNLSTSRHSPSGAIIDGNIYVIGGFNGNNTLNVMERFDTSNNTWESLPSMQQERHSHTSNAIGNNIYVIGGNFSISSVEVFDLESQSWSSRASMGTPRSSHSSCIHGDLIYVFGGRNQNNSLTSVEMYDPSTDTWAYRESNSKLGWGSSCITFGDEIYVFGGANNENGYEVYDPITDMWVRSGVLNSPKRYGFSAESIEQVIYLIGGYTCSGGCRSLNNVDAFNTIDFTWNTNTSMPDNRHNVGSVSHDGAIYIFGGRNSSSNNLSTFEKYDPSLD